MDGPKMNEIVAFLQQRLETEKPDPDEFSTIEFSKAAGTSYTTADGQLNRAGSMKLLSSRKLGRSRYWKVIDQQGWRAWLEGKSQPGNKPASAGI